VHIRIPHWADKKDAVLKLNGVKSDISWESDYAVLEAKANDIISVTWSLVTFTHVSQVWTVSAPELKVEFDWLGNNVIDCRPAAGEGKLPLFCSEPRVLPEYEM